MKLHGIYQNTIYRNADNGYTVFSLKLKEQLKGYDKCQINCAGYIEPNFIGIPLLLTGDIKKENGNVSFIFTNAVPFSVSVDDICNFSSFKGIPQTTVEDMMSAFGNDIFQWDDIPDIKTKLLQFKGIGIKKANKILNDIGIYKKQRKFYDYLAQFGEKANLPENTFAENIDTILERLQKHPYIFGKKCKLSFKCCDTIAKKNGFNANSKERIRAIILNVFEAAYLSGNTCIPLERVFNGIEWTNKHVSAFPDKKISAYLVFSEINSMSSIKSYINRNGNVEYYLNYSYINEVTTAENIKRIQKTKHIHSINLNNIIRKCEDKLNIQYNDIQKSCFKFLESDGLKIITGGPGTGKTTVINGLIYAYQILYPNRNVCLMAPTGRAAQKISEVTGKEAGTIHRLLGINVRHENELISNFNANYPADLIIIDETSMLDNEIAAQALSAFKGGATVIFVGDVNQLPSVGAGNVLHSIINSGIAETAHLAINYRQGDLSTIAENAEKINKGITDLKTDGSFSTVRCENETEMLEKVKETFKKYYDTADPFKTQVLCAVKDGNTGVYKYNNELQTLCNKNKVVLKAGKYEFRKNDKIIITQNNYEDMCFNGDIGCVLGNSDTSLIMSIDNNEITYTRDRLSEIHLAYAMSIHKSQGSEYENVIICLPHDSSNMLKRRLIYTAVTRAKKRVFIYYTGNALEKAILNNNDALRISELEEMLLAS